MLRQIARQQKLSVLIAQEINRLLDGKISPQLAIQTLEWHTKFSQFLESYLVVFIIS